MKQKKQANPMPRCVGCGDTSAELRAGRCEACRGGIYWTEDGLLVVRGHQPEGEIAFNPNQQKVLAERITERLKPRERVPVEDVVEAEAAEQQQVEQQQVVVQAEKPQSEVIRGAKKGNMYHVAVAAGGLLLFMIFLGSQDPSVYQGPSKNTVAAASDSEIISRTETALRSLHIDLREVKIADGRAKGGERAMIISYVHTSGRESDRMGEVIKVLGSGYIANKHSRAEIDSVVAIVGDKRGRAKAAITVKSRDAQWFVKTKDALGYMKKWTVANLDRSFMPVTAENMGW